MPSRPQLDHVAIVLMVVFCTIWGSQQVVIKYANAGISPVWQAGLRSIGAVFLVMLWSWARGVRLFAQDGTLIPGVIAGLLFSLEFGLLYWALEYTTASRGVIFLYTAPFMVAMGAVWLVPGEHMRRSQWLGMVLAFVGVLALFGESLLMPAADTWVGDLMMFGAAVFWAGTTLTIKVSALSRVSAEKTLLYQLVVSALLLPPLALAFGEPGVFAPSPAVWASLLFQIVDVATISYIGWFWLIRTYPITRLSTFSFLTPVMGVVAGNVLLDEPVTPAVFVALGMVALGIVIGNRRPRGGQP